MGKFWALIIQPNLNVERAWVNNEQVAEILSKNPECRVYRQGNDQVAISIDTLGVKQVVWFDAAMHKEYK